jgi:hypothetical protein
MSTISNNLRLGAQGYSSDGGSVFNNKLSKEYDSHSNEPPALAQRFPVVMDAVDKKKGEPFNVDDLFNNIVGGYASKESQASQAKLPDASG